jgi:hypothetical protein
VATAQWSRAVVAHARWRGLTSHCLRAGVGRYRRTLSWLRIGPLSRCPCGPGPRTPVMRLTAVAMPAPPAYPRHRPTAERPSRRTIRLRPSGGPVLLRRTSLTTGPSSPGEVRHLSRRGSVPVRDGHRRERRNRTPRLPNGPINSSTAPGHVCLPRVALLIPRACDRVPHLRC